MMYTVGSAFYGLYFIVSFPVFYTMDEKDAIVSDLPNYSDLVKKQGDKDALVKEFDKVHVYGIREAVMESFGMSMIVLCLLDFGRLLCRIPLTIAGIPLYVYRYQG